MKEAIEAHAANQEQDVFPESVKVLGAVKLEELGEEIERMKGTVGMNKTMSM